MNKIIFNRDNKFDLQLSQALIDERRLAHIFEHVDIHKIELKSETWQWEQTGNIAIEFAERAFGELHSRPSGIAVTEAGCWTHELKRDGKTLCYLMFPIERLKELCAAAKRAGQFRECGGDGDRFSVILLKLRDILK